MIGSAIAFGSCNAGLLRSMRGQFGYWFAVKAAAFTFFSYFYQGIGLALGLWQYLREYDNGIREQRDYRSEMVLASGHLQEAKVLELGFSHDTTELVIESP